MSNEPNTTETPMATQPTDHHAWLQKLVGEWKVVSEMVMGPDKTETSEGYEKTVSLGGLWAFGVGKASMSDGSTFDYRSAIGYDVSFNEYRGCWFGSVSSHLWKYVGTLSEDGTKMTLNCVGPNMVKDGETANYRDIIEIISENERTLTSFGEDEEGNWQQFMKAVYTRI